MPVAASCVAGESIQQKSIQWIGGFQELLLGAPQHLAPQGLHPETTTYHAWGGQGPHAPLPPRKVAEFHRKNYHSEGRREAERAAEQQRGRPLVGRPSNLSVISNSLLWLSQIKLGAALRKAP